MSYMPPQFKKIRVLTEVNYSESLMQFSISAKPDTGKMRNWRFS
jgi:hypothetical protein